MSKTAMAEMEISREKAQAVFELNARLNGKGRRVPKLPESVSKLSTETQVYIFNVGPWQHTQLMGSLGTYHIPACPEGKEYSDPVIIPGIITELYPAGDKYDLLIEENSTGWETAQQIIGVGKHMLPGNSLIKVGVSVSRVWPPSEEDIAKAKGALYNHYIELVNEANAAAAESPALAAQTIRADVHILAARRLRKTVAECPWMERSIEQADRIACIFCGASMGANLPKCPNCNEVVNQKLYKEAQIKARGITDAA